MENNNKNVFEYKINDFYQSSNYVLNSLFDHYGSDKGTISQEISKPYQWNAHTYGSYYSKLFDHCRGDILKAACKPLIEKYHIALDPEEIVYMAQKKKWDSAKTVVADAALIYNLPFLIYHAAFYGSRAYVARYMVGYSVDGVGSVSGSIAMITTAPIVISSPAIFDLLDPSVHNDLGNALKASVDNDSDFDLIREYEEKLGYI